MSEPQPQRPDREVDDGGGRADSEIIPEADRRTGSPTYAIWVVAALLGGVIGTQLGSRWLPVPVLRDPLATVLLIAGLKLILT
jgi:hypothetical protein